MERCIYIYMSRKYIRVIVNNDIHTLKNIHSICMSYNSSFIILHLELTYVLLPGNSSIYTSLIFKYPIRSMYRCTFSSSMYLVPERKKSPARQS